MKFSKMEGTGMEKKTRVAIIGYGNVGKGVELAIEQNPDMELKVIFTRRKPDTLKIRSNAKVLCITEVDKYVNDIDVAVLCGGSATDLPEQGPKFASIFNTVDSYDTHAKIPDYYASLNEAAEKAGKTSIISTGWDPGLFSLLRVIEEIALPQGKCYTFWGPGISQGHSDAIRRIPGVKDARQYTMPIDTAVSRVRAGENPQLKTSEKHWRDCYVVVEDGADLKRIEQEIKKMPYYYADYRTVVTFISEKEMAEGHSEMPHGGFVLRVGKTGECHKQLMEFGLELTSNPEFTGSVLVAYARAAYRLNKEGQIGAKTVFDIAPAYLSMKSLEELRREML
jgi:diaminopimelate dehydrogenase